MATFHSSNLPLLSEQKHLQQRFEKKERECDAKNKEKEDMMDTLNKMKDRLERETNEHKQAKRRVEELSARLQQLSSVRLVISLRLKFRHCKITNIKFLHI